MARTVVVSKKGTKIARKTKAEKAKDKLVQALSADKIVLLGLPLQTIQLLEHYVKYHIEDGEPVLLREVLRLTHRMMPKSMAKSKIRGILGKKQSKARLK